MIHLLHGENEFEKRARLAAILDGNEVDRVDGEDLTWEGLQDLLLGQSLFDDGRAVVIDGLSENTEIWSRLPEILPKTSKQVIFKEVKVDKRTKTYKWLQKNASSEEFKPYGERDGLAVEKWCITQAKEYDLKLTSDLARRVVERLGHDQLRLDNFLQQLPLADEVNLEMIDQLLPLQKSENIFELFEAVIRRDRKSVQKIIAYLELTSGNDGAYQALGLLTSQMTTLAGLVLGGTANEIATDLGAHPFVVRKLSQLSRQVDARRLSKMIDALAKADQRMKSTAVELWLLLETALTEAMNI